MGTQTFIPRDYDVFAGLDVDKKSISVTFTDHQGFLKSLNMPYKVEHLVNYVRKHYPDKKVAFAYEAGPTGYALYDGLEAQAYPCLIASPSMIPKAPGQRVKTNRLDSRGISENLRGGQLKGIHVPTPLYRELRHLTQLRDTLVSEMVRMKQRIKSLLLMEGLEFPPAPAGSQWSFLVKKKLRELPCSSTVRFKLDRLLDSLEFDEKQVLKATREIRRFCQADPETVSVYRVSENTSRDRLDRGQQASGPRGGLAPDQKHPPTVGFYGSGAHRELYRGENRAGLDYPHRRWTIAK